MTDYERLTLQLKICELSLIQVSLEMCHNNPMSMEIESALESTQENIMLLANDIMEVVKNAKTKWPQ